MEKVAAQFSGEDTVLELINMGTELNPKCKCQICFDDYDGEVFENDEYKFESPLTTAICCSMHAIAARESEVA